MAQQKLPAIQFYPGDWLKDNVSGCSLQAQGLWLRMLFLAHESDRRGYLSVNGKPMHPEFIARKCGCDSTDQYLTLLNELFDAGVPSQQPDMTIYSRRMVKDEQKRHKCAQAGKKGGGNPALTFKGHSKGEDKGSVKGSNKGSPKRNMGSSIASSISSAALLSSNKFSESSSSPPTPRGVAAAAFLEIENSTRDPVQDEVDELIQDLVEVRLSAGQSIPREGPYKAKLREVAKSNSNELDDWRVEISRYREKEKKVLSKDFEKNRLKMMDSALDYFSNLPLEIRDDILESSEKLLSERELLGQFVLRSDIISELVIQKFPEKFGEISSSQQKVRIKNELG